MDEVPGAMDRQGDAACSSRNVPVICACNQRYLLVVSRGEKELAADPSFCLQIQLALPTSIVQGSECRGHDILFVAR